jgi:DNA-binding MarR family transcriptional regulator/GNAT superfamily N-acetyltransferase
MNSLPSSTKDPHPTADRVSSVRAFNRFYTNLIGVLRDQLLEAPYTLTEARLIFEMAQVSSADVADLRRRLDIDAGYLSRILARFEAGGLVVRGRSASDSRRQVIQLSDAGRDAFQLLDSRSAEQIRGLLAPLSDEDQRRLIAAMRLIERLLRRSKPVSAVVLRPLGPGDLGWVVHRHGVLYGQEYGWDLGFEALVARIVADYAEQRDPRRETAWIAEVDGEPSGCVFCVRSSDSIAQLRLLLVEPRARGAGIGARLVEECLRFARGAGYERIVLWTNDVLVAARRIYERAGFSLLEQAPHHSFGVDLVGQTWGRPL